MPEAAGKWVLTVLAVDAGPPRRTGAAAGHGVTGRPLPTPAHVGAARAKAAVWTGCREERRGWPLLARSPCLCSVNPDGTGLGQGRLGGETPALSAQTGQGHLPLRPRLPWCLSRHRILLFPPSIGDIVYLHYSCNKVLLNYLQADIPLSRR